MKDIYADTLGFIGGTMGPPEFTDDIFSRLKRSGVSIVQWGGPHPYPKNGWDDLCAEVLSTSQNFQKHSDVFQLVRQRNDLDRVGRNDLVHVIMTVQNPACIGDRFKRLDQLWDAGVRVMQLTYWDERDSIYGSGWRSEEDNGLTALGKEYLVELSQRGFILDLSHASPKTALEAAIQYRGPVMISHTGCRAVYEYPRGTTNEVIRTVAKRGGIIGVYAMTFFLDAEDNSLLPWLRHIEHMAKLIDLEKICVGSDAPVTGFPDLKAAEADFPKLTAALSRGRLLEGKLAPRWPAFVTNFNGVDRFRIMRDALQDEVGASTANDIVGLNALRFYRQALPA